MQSLGDHAHLPEYFDDFRRVSRAMYNMLGKADGVAHTDLVKCFSPQWPPEAARSLRDARKIIANCREYLQPQLLAKPVEVKVLVCNGAAVSSYIREMIPPKEDQEAYYYGELNEGRVAVVLSGFIGRMDQDAKRRLGKEVEALMDELGARDKAS
jgi:hypothetical protein